MRNFNGVIFERKIHIQPWEVHLEENQSPRINVHYTLLPASFFWVSPNSFTQTVSDPCRDQGNSQTCCSHLVISPNYSAPLETFASLETQILSSQSDATQSKRPETVLVLSEVHCKKKRRFMDWRLNVSPSGAAHGNCSSPLHASPRLRRRAPKVDKRIQRVRNGIGSKEADRFQWTRSRVGRGEEVQAEDRCFVRTRFKAGVRAVFFRRPLKTESRFFHVKYL